MIIGSGGELAPLCGCFAFRTKVHGCEKSHVVGLGDGSASRRGRSRRCAGETARQNAGPLGRHLARAPMRAPFQAASSAAAGRRPGSGGRGRARATRGKTSRPRGFAAADWGTPAPMFPGGWRAFGRGATRWRSVAAPRPAAGGRCTAWRGGHPAVPRSASTSILRRVRAALGARIRGTTSLDARRHAEHPPAACFCASSSSRPRRGGARARTNQGQLDVLKVRCFPDARCCPRRRTHADQGQNDAMIRVRGGIVSPAAQGRRAAPGSARP